MNLIDPSVEAYASLFSDVPNPLLDRMEREVRASHPEAHMLSGPLQGSFLAMLSRLLQPSRILEIGTFRGYSAICLIQGLAPGGVLHTIEIRPEDAALAEGYFREAGCSGRVVQHVGDARAIAGTLHETWDLVFLDADKTGYIDYYELTLPHIRPGGCLLVDNVLFHGQVLSDPPVGKNAKAVHAFNRHVQADARVEKVMLTLRDGLYLIRKK